MTELPVPPVFTGAPMAQITPFTYREGATLMYIVERLKRWSVELGPEVQKIIDDAVNQFSNDIEIIKSDWQKYFDDFIADVIAQLEALNDQSVANLIGNIQSFTRKALEQDFISRDSSILPYERAYFKKIKHHLPFKFPDFAAAQAIYGAAMYPQSFNVDTRRDELFVSYTVAGYGVVAVYDWSTGQYKSCFGYASAYGSEGLEITYEGDTRYFWCRYLVNGLGKFDVTNLPATTSMLAPVQTFPLNMGINFTRKNGVWTVADNSRPIGLHVDRSFLKQFDDSFNEVGQVRFPPLSMGGSPYKYRQNTIPKTQGFCDMGGQFAIGMGGYYNPGSTSDAYTHQGVRVVSGRGETLLDCLVDAPKMFNILIQNDVPCSRIENEGIQFIDNKLYSLTVTESYGSTGNPTTGGLLFLEEFSSSKDAIDFSSAATTWTVPNFDVVQYGVWPRQFDNSLHDPVTGEVLDSLAKIREMMISLGVMQFNFYSSSVSVKNVVNNVIPSGYYVTVRNSNNSTFMVDYFNGQYNFSERIYPDPNSAGSLKAVTSDTGWLPITLTSGVVPFSSTATPAIRCKNGVTYIRGAVKGVPRSPSNFNVGSFDSQFAPEVDVIQIQGSEGLSTVRWHITSNGGLFIQNNSNDVTSTDTWYPLPQAPVIGKDA